MKIIKTSLPKNSLLLTENKIDYIDSFQGIFKDPENKITSADIGKSFFMSGPKWVEKLFNLRNKIVAIFGLKTSEAKNKQQQLDEFKCEPGEQLGLFKVIAKSENEVILGEDDKHLNFRVSLFMEKDLNVTSQKLLTISTTVMFNNWFGKLYFLPVRPFHKLIAPTMLREMIKDLEKRKN